MSTKLAAGHREIVSLVSLVLKLFFNTIYITVPFYDPKRDKKKLLEWDGSPWVERLPLITYKEKLE